MYAMAVVRTAALAGISTWGIQNLTLILKGERGICGQ